MAVTTKLPVSTISVGSQSGSPCSSSTYTSINDPSRSYNYTGNLGACDDDYPFVTSSGGAWIRFEGSGGTKIPSWATDSNHCNAVLTVWANTTLPTAVNVIVNGTTCISGIAIGCISAQPMSVIYCPGNYYVYLLQPVLVCKARYCTI